MLSIVIPLLNEEEILEKSVITVRAYLLERSIEHEIVVVSNGSTDKTVEIGERLELEASAHGGWFRMFSIPEAGPGKAFALGVKESRGDVVISLDIDLSFEMGFIDFALHLINWADIVVGSKAMGTQRRSAVRVLGSQAYILCTQLLFGLTISDYSIGCKAYRKAALLPVIDRIDPWTGYVLELCIYLKEKGRRIIQIGVECDDCRASRFSLFHEAYYRYRHLYRMRRKISRAGGIFAE